MVHGHVAPHTETVNEPISLRRQVWALSYRLSVGFISLKCALGNINLEIQRKDIVETLFITLYRALFVKTLDINLFLVLILEIIMHLFLNWFVFILLTLW